MKKLSKILAISLSLILIAGAFYGCGLKKDGKNDGKLKVVATIFPQYDFLRQIGGDKIDLKMLLTPGAESHSFEPTPKDIKAVKDADLFVYVGGDSDSWVEEILEGVDKDKLKTVTLMDTVKTVPEETVEGMQEEHDHEGHHHDEDSDHEKDSEHHEDSDKHHEHEHDKDKEDVELDEHVWTSPKNAIEIVKKLSDELGALDPENKDYFKKNADEYIKKLEGLDGQFKEVVENGKRKEIIFGDRFPFRYFVDAYGLKYYAAFPGCSTDTEASANTVAFLIDKIKTDKIPVVFHIELSNTKMAESISEATGAKIMQLNAVHNVSKEDFEKGVTYLDLMTKNLDALKEALN